MCLTEENEHKVLTKTAYEHLVAAVGQMLEEGKKAGQQADSSLAKIYWTIGNKLMEAGLIGRDHYGESVIEQLAEDLEINAQTIRRAVVFRRVYRFRDVFNWRFCCNPPLGKWLPR